MTDRDASQLAGSPQPPQRIRELVIRREHFPNGYSELIAKIDDSGRLVLAGSDGGKFASEAWVEDRDYDYEEVVQGEWKDSLLLHLVRERFETTSAFRKWCEERGIPTQFCAWT